MFAIKVNTFNVVINDIFVSLLGVNQYYINVLS